MLFAAIDSILGYCCCFRSSQHHVSSVDLIFVHIERERSRAFTHTYIQYWQQVPSKIFSFKCVQTIHFVHYDVHILCHFNSMGNGCCTRNRSCLHKFSQPLSSVLLDAIVVFVVVTAVVDLRQVMISFTLVPLRFFIDEEFLCAIRLIQKKYPHLYAKCAHHFDKDKISCLFDHFTMIKCAQIVFFRRFFF